MLFLKSTILALIQALTEFLPISSSGHLAIVQKIFNLSNFNLSFDVFLHLGSALALIIFFYKDWIQIFKEAKDDFKNSLFLKLIIGLIPAAIFGFLINFYNLSFNQSLTLIIFNTIFFALILFWADKNSGEAKLKSLNFMQVILIGIAQALALFPGVSRSGITITAALFLGLNRSDSARFSFILATPAILGANIIELPKLSNLAPNLIWPYILGFIASLIFSYLVVAWLLNYLKNNRLLPFVIYRLILGLTLIILLITHII